MLAGAPGGTQTEVDLAIVGGLLGISIAGDIARTGRSVVVLGDGDQVFRRRMAAIGPALERLAKDLGKGSSRAEMPVSFLP
jgi:hypothetical protein